MKHIIICSVLFLSAAINVWAAGDARTEKFLRGYRHGQSPYVLPVEGSLEEIKWIADHGFNAMGVGFAAPYNNGAIDWSKLDEAVAMLARDGRKTVIHLYPRFAEADGVSDVLSTGQRVISLNDKSPNYSMLDVFDPVQKYKFHDYLTRGAERYGSNPDVIGFVFGWGFQGETGFYTGDFFAGPDKNGSEAAGYSEHALLEYNRWRSDRGRTPLDKLPMPSTERQSDDYIDWMHFRHWFVGEVFQRGAVDAIKAKTDKPVGTFGYCPASNENYARAWCYTPNVDFFRSAGSASSFDNTRVLQDSAIGWEDSGLHSGGWDFTAARMICDEARMIAKGAVYHGMYARVYKTEPQWEKDVYEKVSQFIINQDLYSQIKPEKATVALFQPTWSSAVIPGKSAKQLFVPREDNHVYVTKMVGLVESFGLAYELVFESDLASEERLAKYDQIILPMSDQVRRFLGEKRAGVLLKDKRVIPLPLSSEPVKRSKLRDALKSAGAAIGLDYDAEVAVAGRVNNLVFNWAAKPAAVRIHTASKWEEVELAPNAFKILK